MSTFTVFGNPTAETFKQILQSLQLRFLFPAILLVLCTTVLFSSVKLQTFSPYQILFLILAAIILSYMFSALNGVIIRFAEGYELQGDWVFYLPKKLEERREKRTDDQISKNYKLWLKAVNIINAATKNEELTSDQLENLNKLKNVFFQKNKELKMYKSWRFHPKSPLATSFGNTIAAFENYPADRYHMDAVAIWPRLMPIIEKREFTPFVQNEKSNLDFLVNTWIVSLIMCLELLISLNLYAQKMLYLSMFVLVLLISILFFKAAVAAAKDWGIMVCTAFDLFRFDLFQMLQLKESPESFDDEKRLWEAYSRFLSYGETSNFEGFHYRTKERSNT